MTIKMLSTAVLAAVIAMPAWADDSVLGQQSAMVQMLKQYDTNNDGVITRDELVAAKTAEFKAADTNSDGFLSWQEFKAIEDAKASARLKAIYTVMDADAKDGISITEFTNSSPERPAAQANTVFTLADTDASGALSLEELAAMRKEGGVERLMWMFAGQDNITVDKQISLEEYTVALKPITGKNNGTGSSPKNPEPPKRK